MYINFMGAAREVTGSNYLIEVNGKKILIDCGLYQGNRKVAFEKNRNFPFDPKEIDALFLTHAHIDHSGNIPSLIKQGFQGQIFSTFATRDLCRAMLLDSAYIHEREAEYLNKKQRYKDDPIEPLYTYQNAIDSLQYFSSVYYNRTIEPFKGVKLTFHDAGHILGSAQIKLEIDDMDTKQEYSITFSGDLGRKNLPILRPPEQITYSDYLVTETTYGDRLHGSLLEVEEIFREKITGVIKNGGKIIIPAFSVERTQEIVYFLNLLTNKNKIPDIPVFVDSPLAVRVTDIFSNHPECFDSNTFEQFLDKNLDPFGLNKINYITDVNDSKALNLFKGSCVIISASGMCEFGRVLHHIKNNIEDPNSLILIVGWQAPYTLGRKLLDGEKSVNIFRKPYSVNVKVEKLNAFSGHADRSDLMNNILHMKGLKHIFLCHGEESQSVAFLSHLKEIGHNNVSCPFSKDRIEIGTKEQLKILSKK